MDSAQGLELAKRNAEEVVEGDQLKRLLETKARPRGYIGYEPSGYFHIAQGLVTGAKILDLMKADVHMIVFLADWHAYINEKMGGEMARIQTCAEYLKVCFKAMGIEGPGAEFLYASEFARDPAYWQLVLDVGQHASLNRVKRAITIMGRKEDEAEVATAKLIYPLMQVADIFHMKLDIACAGMDQRRAHMLCRDVAGAMRREKPVAIHTPILPALQGSGRMEMDWKMSKSKPETAVFFHDPDEIIQEKLTQAFCPPKELDMNPVTAFTRHVVIPMRGSIKVERPAKFGGDVEFASAAEFEAAYRGGKLHPQDLKGAVSRALCEILRPIRSKVVASPEFKAMSDIAPPP